MERDEAMDGTADAIAHFNSHAHVERDKIKPFNSVANAISTHTLTWSVTIHIIVYFSPSTFQLTRSRGA